MKRHATSTSPGPRWRAGLLVAALAGAAGPPAIAQGFDNAGACATSRAQQSIDTVAAAMISWLTDVISGVADAPALGSSTCASIGPVDIALVPAIPVADLRALLVPFYIASIPANDPWGTPYDYRLNVANPLSLHAIALRSAGSDHLFEGATYEVGETDGPAGDLVHYNGDRVRRLPRLDPVARQQVTVARLQNLGAAMLSWVTDNVLIEPGRPAGGPTVDLTLITPIAVPDLALLLTPFYTLCVPERDGWGHSLDLRLNDDLLGTPVMSIRSSGSDGVDEGDLYDTELFVPEDFARDLVWSDGFFFQSPSPTRTQIFTDSFESATLWGTWTCGPGF